MCTPSFGKGFVVLFKLSQENFCARSNRLTGRWMFRQTDGQTDKQTDRWTKSTSLIPSGVTGRGLICKVFDKTVLLLCTKFYIIRSIDLKLHRLFILETK